MVGCWSRKRLLAFMGDVQQLIRIEEMNDVVNPMLLTPIYTPFKDDVTHLWQDWGFFMFS